ncbi:MAG: hypothetical protein IKS22_08160 [Bacteroidales bacterium]|nr:hypothetical protein [Bacteroidales bacterium]
MKRTTTLILACMLSAAAAHAQTVDLQFAPRETKLIGPSPEAAAMTRYADTPVSYCLGQTEVTIPLYELKSRSITLPIYLSYDSSGVKVDAVSGPAGLNWTLMAGGVITRTVAGLPDEYMNGYRCVRPARQAYPFATEEGQMLSSDYEYLTYATQGNADREWDLYSYSFAGRSGSFYAVHEPGSYVYDIVPTSATPLTIRRLGTAGFTITDEDGTTWVFSLAETTSRTVSTASPGLNAGGPSAENTAQDITTVTAWYLSAAVPMDGKGTVTFTYDTLGTLYNERRSHSRTYSFTYRYLSPGSYQWMGPSGQWFGPPVAVQNMEASYVTETGWTPHVVKTVTWAGGHAVFDYTEDARDEIIGAVRNSYPSVLTSMRLYADGDTTAFRTVTFSVKGNRTGDGRNLLKDVTVRGRDGGVIESYSFDYKDENTSMAPNAKDLFGYWNSASSNQSTAFLRLFEDNYTITEHAADRGYNPSAVSALSLTGVTTASGSRTEFVYEGNSIPTGGASELFSVIGIGHRIRKIRTFDLSGSSGNGGNGGSTGTLVRERTFTYSGSGCTIPLTAFNRGSFSSVSEVFREDLVSGHPWWSGPTNPIPRTATVCLADQSMLPGAPLEGARIFHSTVTEKVCSPDGETVRTDYVFDCSGAVAQYGGGSWSLTQEHSDHDDNPLNNVLGSHLYHFFRRPPYRVPRTSGGPSVDFTPFMFHFTDRDRPEFGQPVEIRTYRTGEDGAETLVGRTVNTFGRAESDLQTGLAVKNLISQGDAQNMRGYRFCALDFFQQEVHRTLVHRRLRKSAVTSYLDEGTEKTTETVYTYGMGSRTSATDVTYYPVPVAPMETDSYPESGSVLSPRMETTVVDGDPSRVYSRYHIYPDELAAAGDGTDGYGWAASLLSKGYRRPVGEEILVGGGVTAGGTTFFGGTPVSKSGRYVTWDTFAPADGVLGERVRALRPRPHRGVNPPRVHRQHARVDPRVAGWRTPGTVLRQGDPHAVRLGVPHRGALHSHEDGGARRECRRVMDRRVRDARPGTRARQRR